MPTRISLARHADAFIEFVLSHYVSSGVDELDPQKLAPLLRLKYHSVTDAVSILGSTDEIKRTFTAFQSYLYQQQTAA
jgi:type I restriction enzyme, R subunit